MRRVHTINLSNAWEPPPAAGGPWIRRFGRPAGLTRHARVWLVIEQTDAVADVRLNGLPLTGPHCVGETRDAPPRREITGALEPRNVLTLLVTEAATTDAMAAPVAAHGRRPGPPACGRVWIEIEVTDQGPSPAR